MQTKTEANTSTTNTLVRFALYVSLMAWLGLTVADLADAGSLLTSSLLVMIVGCLLAIRAWWSTPVLSVGRAMAATAATLALFFALYYSAGDLAAQVAATLICAAGLLAFAVRHRKGAPRLIG